MEKFINEIVGFSSPAPEAPHAPDLLVSTGKGGVFYQDLLVQHQKLNCYPPFPPLRLTPTRGLTAASHNRKS